MIHLTFSLNFQSNYGEKHWHNLVKNKLCHFFCNYQLCLAEDSTIFNFFLKII